MPRSSGACRMLRPAMTQRGTASVWMSPLMARSLRRPAAGRAGARHLAERPPAFVGCRSRLLDRPAHGVELAQEIVELRLDLAAESPAGGRQIQQPHTPPATAPSTVALNTRDRS